MTNDPSEQKRRWRGERERGLRKASTCLIVRRFSAVGHSPRTHERTSFAYLPLPVCPRCSPEYLVPDIWYLFVPRGRYRGEISCGCNADRTMWIYIYIYARNGCRFGQRLRITVIVVKSRKRRAFLSTSAPSRTRRIARRTSWVLLLFNRAGRKGPLTMGDNPERAKDWSRLDLRVDLPTSLRGR